MKTTWTRIMAIALLASMPMAALADEDSPTYTTYNHPIIGVWDATVIIKDCTTGEVLVTAHALNAFMPGGMLLDANTMPVGMRGQSFGRWEPAWSDQPDQSISGVIDYDHIGQPPLVTGRMRFYRYNEQGFVAGTNVIGRQVQVSADGLTYTGVADGHMLDTAGNELTRTCTTETAVRVE